MTYTYLYLPKMFQPMSNTINYFLLKPMDTMMQNRAQLDKGPNWKPKHRLTRSSRRDRVRSSCGAATPGSEAMVKIPTRIAAEVSSTVSSAPNPQVLSSFKSSNYLVCVNDFFLCHYLDKANNKKAKQNSLSPTWKSPFESECDQDEMDRLRADCEVT